MAKVVAGFMVIGLVATSALGGTVQFVPDEATFHQGVDGDLSMDVSVLTEAGGNFESVDVIIGSDSISMDPSDWAYSTAAEGAFMFIGTPAVQTIYPYGIGDIGGFAFPEVSSPFDLGTLTLRAAVLDALPLGDYMVKVNGDDDDGRSNVALGTCSERIFGSALIHVVPEPMTVALLGLGAVGLLRRRK